MVLKVGRCVQIRMGLGSEFQREGAAMEKARSPQVRCLVHAGGERMFPSDEWRSREGVWWWSRSVR